MRTPRAAAMLMTLLAGALHAQAQVSASADRTVVALGEQIVVTVKIVSSKRVASIPPPSIPANDDFTVVRTNQNSSQSSSIQIVNGRMTQTVEITYFIYYAIAPKHEGSFTFPALQIALDGQNYATAPFAVTVGKQPVQSAEVLVRPIARERDVYVGQQVVVTLQIAQKAQSAAQLTQQGVGDFMNRFEAAAGKSFSVSRLTNGPLKGGAERIGGEIYNVFRVNYALFPLNPGTLTVPGLPFEYIVQKRVEQQRGGDPFFNDFFGGGGFFGFGNAVQEVAKSAMSSPLTVVAKSLPPAPANFSGAVGSFTFGVEADPRTVAAGDAATLKIALRGDTRPGSMGDIKLPDIPGCEVFTPEKHVFTDTTAGGLVTRKTYSYLVIPQDEGAATIPPVEWVVFDPAAKTYRTLRSEPIALTVTKGKGGKKEQARYLTQAEIREVGKDIRYIKTAGRLANRPDKPYRDPLFFVLYPLPFMLALFSLLYRVQSTRQKDVAVSRRQRALRTALRRVELVRKQAASLSGADLLGKVSGIIEAYVSHKFGFAATGRTLDELQTELVTRGVKAGVVDTLVGFVRGMDVYRFGGTSLDESAKAEMLRKTAGIIEELEKAARKEKRA